MALLRAQPRRGDPDYTDIANRLQVGVDHRERRFPSPKLSVRVDLHRLDLATSQDRWYSGSGATQKAGTNFGYAGRRSNGATSLGTMIEGSADRAISRHWSVNGYVGVMKGGDVVRRTFAGDWLTFAYVESVVQIGGRVAGNAAPP